jgi:tetrahydromethanopterin S-methyltransferase subunit H
MIKWYNSLAAPSKDPLVLAIGLFWARHVFIHHFPSGLLTVKDNKIVEAVQCRLAELVREALSDCFDVPHIHHVYGKKSESSKKNTF